MVAFALQCDGPPPGRGIHQVGAIMSASGVKIGAVMVEIESMNMPTR